MDAPTTDPTGPPPPPPPPFGTPHRRELRRRPDEGHLGGVCAGVAEYFAVDPILVRIAAVVLALSGPGVIAYILAWIFIPEAGDDRPHPPFGSDPDRRDRGAQVFGIVLLVIAVSILWGGWWSPARRWFFPLGLIALGAWLIFRRSDDRPLWPSSPGAGDRPPAPPVPEPSAFPTATPTDTGTPALALPPTASTLPVPPVPPWAGGHGSGPERAPLTEEQLVARRRRKMVLPSVLGALLVWGGLAVLLGVAVETGLAVALCIVGIGFVLGSFVGGGRVLVLPALLIGAALVATAALDLPLRGPVGGRSWAPQEVSDVRDAYELSVGEGTLDLTAAGLGAVDELGVEASVGIGHLVIVVPDDVVVDVRAEASAGDIVVFGRSDSGLGVSVDRVVGEGEHDRTITLDLRVGLGQIEVVPDGRTTVLR